MDPTECPQCGSSDISNQGIWHDGEHWNCWLCGTEWVREWEEIDRGD